MSKCIQLPSGRIVNIDDIIYISNPKYSKSSNEWSFDITWAYRIVESLNYLYKDVLELDRNELIKNIMQ